MKRFISAQSFAFLTAFVLLACNAGSTNNDPKEVAKNYFEAFKLMQLDEASKYATWESQSVLSLMKMGLEKTPIKTDDLKAEFAKHTITYGEPVIKGDDATVSVSIDNSPTTDLKLKKEDGLWKVDFNMNSLFNAGMEKMEQSGVSEKDIEEAKESLKRLNTDSLQGLLEQARKEIDSLH